MDVAVLCEPVARRESPKTNLTRKRSNIVGVRPLVHPQVARRDVPFLTLVACVRPLTRVRP